MMLMIVVMLVYEDYFQDGDDHDVQAKKMILSQNRVTSRVVFFGNILNLERESPEDLSKRMQVALWYLNPATLPPFLLFWTKLKELDEEV